MHNQNDECFLVQVYQKVDANRNQDAQLEQRENFGGKHEHYKQSSVHW